jgi:hypothetical protein
MNMNMNRILTLSSMASIALLTPSLSAHASDDALAPKDWNWSSGIDNRTRYESMGEFRDATDDTKNVVYNRLRINATVNHKDEFTLFVEGLDAREWTHSAPERNQQDDLDLLQAYASFNHLFGSGFRAKLGRQTISYGRKRILSAPTWGNKIRAFDAATVGWRGEQWKSDVFFGNRVTYESGFNTPNTDEKLTGIYNVWHINDATSLDTYAVLKETPLASTDGVALERDRYTTGIRLVAKTATGTAVDAEVAYQFGDEGDSEVNAYALACRIDQSFDVVGKPRLGVEVNVASGDSDPDDNTSRTFIPPYQATHGGYGIIDLFKWQNLREVALFGSVEISPDLVIKPEVHAYWLDQAEDAWFSTSGGTLRAADASKAATYAGAEVSLVTQYRLNKHASLSGGYSLFLLGDVADDISDENAVHYGYAQISYQL